MVTVLLGGTSASHTQASIGECDPEDGYGFSSDPTVATLELSSFGSAAGSRIDLLFFGDGRLVKRLQNLGEQARETMVSLDFDQVEALLEIAVHHRLATTHQRQLDTTVRDSAERLMAARARPGIPPPVWIPPVDAATATLSIRLSHCGTLGPVENRLTIVGLETIQKAFPEIVELKGWVEILGRLHGFLVEGPR
jgi:hypothetical protein